MNESLSTFMKIAVTSITISLLLFGVAYTLLDKEAGEYKTEMESHRVLP